MPKRNTTCKSFCMCLVHLEQQVALGPNPVRTCERSAETFLSTCVSSQRSGARVYILFVEILFTLLLICLFGFQGFKICCDF